MIIAPEGQCLAQFPQLTPSVFTTHKERSVTALPICMELFSSMLIGRMAPAGHTEEHSVHSGLQYPFSNPIWGIMKDESDEDGLSTPLGQLLTQSWQATQWSVKFFRLPEPAGTSGVLLTGSPALG